MNGKNQSSTVYNRKTRNKLMTLHFDANEKKNTIQARTNEKMKR